MFQSKKLAIFAIFALFSLYAEAQTNSVADSTAVAVDTLSSKPMSRREFRKNRGLSNIKNHIVPKGQWIFGGTMSYSTHTNSSYNFLVVDDIDSKGYTLKVSPIIGYALRQNSMIGARLVYSRSFLEMDSAALNLGEGDGALNFGVDYYYALKHSYEVIAIWRQYIPLGRSKRLALFSEFQLSFGGSQSKFAEGSPIRGTFAKSFDIALGVNPGIVAFVTNNMAFEVNVGVLGLSYSHTEQIHNQIMKGETSASLMNFKINILSIGLGVAFYL